ncbi:MAG: ABC transporter permease [Phormidesmis sp.]
MTLNQLPRVRYTSASRLRNPRQFFLSMLKDLAISRELAWRLMVRDIKSQYRQSFLGIFWAFIPSLSMALGLTLARNSGLVHLNDTSIPYPVYVFISMALWQTFVESLQGPAIAVGAAKSMLTKIQLPYEAIILSKVGEIFFNFGIKLIFIGLFFLWFRQPISWSILLAPLAVIHLVILGISFGLWLAPIGALYKDIQQSLLLITAPWMLMTPVIYDIPAGGGFKTLVRLNPVTPLLVTARQLSVGTDLTEIEGFWLVSGLMLILLMLGWILYKLSMPMVIERMSS